MWRALILLCLAAGSRQLSITEFIVPAALEAGGDAELQCKYDLLQNESDRRLFVKWWWTPLNNGSDTLQLYQRIVGHPAELVHQRKLFSDPERDIEILKDDGLRLVNVTPKISGIYECEVSIIEEARRQLKMVVFSMGSGPMMNVSVLEEGDGEDEGEQEAGGAAVVSCEAYNVAPRPDLVITLNGQKLKTSGNVIDLQGGLYDVYENATLPLDEAENGEFKCEIFYEDVEVPHAPCAVSQMFTAPTVSTPEPEAPATEPTEAAPQPDDSGSYENGASWLLLTLLSSLIVLLQASSK